MLVGMSSLLATYSPARAAIFAVLVSEPERSWNVASLAKVIAGMPCDVVERDLLRANLLLLLDSRIADEVPDCRPMTVRLCTDGASVLAKILRGWRDQGERVPLAVRMPEDTISKLSDEGNR